MSEHLDTQPALPDMELINIVEGMTREQREDEKDRLLSEISDRETLVNIINTVQDIDG